jgi:hypothetical protein
VRYTLAHESEKQHETSRKNRSAGATGLLDKKALGALLLRNAASDNELGIVTEPIRHHRQNS